MPSKTNFLSVGSQGGDGTSTDASESRRPSINRRGSKITEKLSKMLSPTSTSSSRAPSTRASSEHSSLSDDANGSAPLSESEASPRTNDAEWLAGRKYILSVQAGPSYDTSTHKQVHVNSNQPLHIENEHMSISVNVRIKDYIGLPRGSPSSSAYFESTQHSKDRYSIGFSFVPKRNIPASEIIWGNDFDHPIRDRLPPGFNTAFGIVKRFIDPGLSCDAYADEPWLYGPALSTWFTFRIGERAEELNAPTNAKDEAGIIEEGADGDGEDIRKQANIPENADKRRKHFLTPANREKVVFEKGRVYHVDFFNPYLDFNKFALRLPGFSLGVLRYIDDKTHNLRYVFKRPAVKGDDEDQEEVYLVVVFTLLFGDELRQALGADQPPAQPISNPPTTDEIHGLTLDSTDKVDDDVSSEASLD